MCNKDGRLKNRFLTLMLIGWMSLSPLLAHAENYALEVGTRNLADIEDAEKVAQELISKSKVGDEVVLYHTGESLPESLKYVIRRCSRARLSVNLVKISPETLAEDFSLLDQAPPAYQQLLTYDAPKESTWKSVLGSAKKLVQKIFGESPNRAPNRLFGVTRFKDLSIWVKVPRNPSLIRFDRSRALISSALASTSLGLSYVFTYLTKNQAPDASMILPTVALGAWVYITMVHFRSINEVMSQGKSVEATPTGWKLVPNAPFYWTTSFLRGLFTNAIISIAKNGPMSLLNLDSFEASTKNAALNVLSRSEIDRWIAEHMPTTRDLEGKVVILPGQWSERKVANVNLLWSTTQGFIKNLNYIANDPQFHAAPSFQLTMNLLFGGLAAVNVGMMLKPVASLAWDQAAMKWSKLIKKADSTLDVESKPTLSETCQSLLTLNSAKASP